MHDVARGSSADHLERINAFHADRDPARVARKYARMRVDPFAFLRGTNFLFQSDIAERADARALHEAPLAWQCGDMHAENFGSFRGGNRLVYFDVNDFDDACLAPALHDLARLVTSIAVAARMHGNGDDAAALARVVVDAYAVALRDGKAWWVERATAKGIVRDLLVHLQTRSDDAFYRSRCKLGRRPRLRIDGERALEAPDSERARIAEMLTAGLHDYAPSLVVHDVARRVAGNGSLGTPRWVALVEHALESERWALLDLKSPAVSASTMATPPQPAWTNESERVVQVQRLMQAAPPAMLRVLTDADGALVLRELMPSDDRVQLEDAFRRPRAVQRLLRTMGRLLAWAQLRASGRLGAANGDALVTWARTEDWQQPVVAFAMAYAKVVEDDWVAFRDRAGGQG